MATSFKCRRNKEHANWFCLVCRNVFHKSCWMRKSPNSYVIVRENLIWCSKTCIEQAGEMEADATDVLRARIADLEAKLDQKNAHISRLNRKSLSFYEEATKSEEEFIKEIETLKSNNRELNKKLMKHTLSEKEKNVFTSATQTSIEQKDAHTQMERCETSDMSIQVTPFYTSTDNSSQTEPSYCMEMDSLRKSNKVFKENLLEMENMGKSLRTSVEVLAAENAWYASEIKLIQNELNQYSKSPESQGEDINEASEKSDEEGAENNGKGNIKRVLIYGDESAKGCSVLLRSMLDRRYQVWGMVKPHALYLKWRNIFSACV